MKGKLTIAKALQSDRVERAIFIILFAILLGALSNLMIQPYNLVVPAAALLLMVIITGIWYRRTWLLLVVVGVFTAESLYIETGGIVLRTIDLVVLLLAMLNLFRWLLQDETKFEFLPVFNGVLILLVFIGLVSLFGTISLSNSLLELLQIVELIIACLLFYNLVKTKEDIHYLLKAIWIYSILDVLWILYQHKAGQLHGRHIGLFQTLASELSYGVAISAYLFFVVKRNWQRLLVLVLALSQMYAIYLTLTRGLFVTMVIMTLVVIFLGALQHKKILPAVALTLVMLTGSMILFSQSPASVQTRFASIVEGGQMRDLRLIMWAVGLKVWQSSPVFGVGIGNLELASRQVIADPTGLALVAMSTGSLQSPHNEYLHFAVQAGWIGFIAAFLFYGNILLNSLRIYTRSPDDVKANTAVLFSFVVGLVILNLANDALFAGKGMWIVLLMALLARMHASTKDSKKLLA